MESFQGNTLMNLLNAVRGINLDTSRLQTQGIEGRYQSLPELLKR